MDIEQESAAAGRRDVQMLTVHVPKEKEGTYFTVPFEVPEGVVRLDVTYHYPGHVKGAAGDRRPVNTIDLGLADETGSFSAGPAVRRITFTLDRLTLRRGISWSP